MSDKLRLLIGSVTVALFAACCGSGGATDPSQNSGSGDADVTLLLGHNLALDTPTVEATEFFKELVEDRSEGEIEVELFPAGQQGNEQQMLEGLGNGSLDIAIVVGSTYGNLVPDANVLGVLYVFRDVDHLVNTMAGEPGQLLAEKITSETPMRVLDSWYFGTRQLTSNRPIETPDDLSGLKIRVVPVPVFLTGWELMGATPTPVDFQELYTSLETGVVDAQENPVTLIKAAGFPEVQSYLNLTGHTINNFFVSIADSTYDELSDEHRDVIISALEEAGERHNQLTIKQEEELIEVLTDEDSMVLVEPNVEAFRMEASGIAAEFEDGQLKELYDSIQEVE